MHTTSGAHPNPFELNGLDADSASVFGAFMRAGRIQYLLMLRVLAEHGIPPGQAMCLRSIALAEGLTQRELGDRLHLSAPTVTAMLKRMERHGTIVREPDRVDQRVTRIQLTPTGRGLERTIRAVLAARIGELLEPMPAADRRDLARLLGGLADRMANALEERAPEAANAMPEREASGAVTPDPARVRPTSAEAAP